MARKKRNPDETPVAEKILDAATLLFSTVGYENTSMKAIAAEADITPGALYYHYANKQEIVFRTLERAVLGLAELGGAETRKHNDPVAALRSFVEHHIRYQVTSLNTVASVYTALVYGMRRQPILSPPQLNRLRELETLHLDTLKDILKRGQEAGLFHRKSTTLTSFAILGMCEHVNNWFRPEGSLSTDAIARFFADQALLIARGSSSAAAVPRRPRHPAISRAVRG